MSEHPIVIVGAGPVGMMLAGELALAGVAVAIVERRGDQAVVGQRAGGLQARTIEVLDQRGIAERFLAAGTIAQVNGFGGFGPLAVRFDISDFPSRHPYGLALWQPQIERLLAEWIAELGVPIRYGEDVIAVTQDGEGVSVQLADGRTLRAAYVVGCDGGRSVVRKAAGIAFPGWDATTSNLIAEAELAEEPDAWGMRNDAVGIHGLSREEGGTTVRIMVTEQHVGASGPPSLKELSAALVAVYGTDYGVHSPTSLSRFTDMTRQAASYRAGRILLAGDAAHVHSPVGGQGLNIGVQEAVNLGWKLAQVLDGVSPPTLLDTYHSERHPIAARVLRATMAQVALLRPPDERMTALGEIVAELLRMDEPRTHIAAMMSGLDVHYHTGDGHPLVGRRMPDLDLATVDGPRRVFTFLHEARPVFLNLGAPGAIDSAPWPDRVRRVDASYAGSWELPVLGTVTGPAAVLIRPDGYVAWAGGGDDGLGDALATWFGFPNGG